MSWMTPREMREAAALVIPVDVYKGVRWWLGDLRHSDLIMSSWFGGPFLVLVANLPNRSALQNMLALCGCYAEFPDFLGFIWRHGHPTTEKWGLENGGVRGYENRMLADGMGSRFLRVCEKVYARNLLKNSTSTRSPATI